MLPAQSCETFSLLIWFSADAVQSEMKQSSSRNMMLHENKARETKTQHNWVHYIYIELHNNYGQRSTRRSFYINVDTEIQLEF